MHINILKLSLLGVIHILKKKMFNLIFFFIYNVYQLTNVQISIKYYKLNQHFFILLFNF